MNFAQSGAQINAFVVCDFSVADAVVVSAIDSRKAPNAHGERNGFLRRIMTLPWLCTS